MRADGGAEPAPGPADDAVPLRPTEIVAAGYDAIAACYREWSASTPEGTVPTWLDRYALRVPVGSAVLDLGCGSGVPWTRWLAARYAVTGIDVSAEQVATARASVPNATILHADLTTLDLPAESFDGAVALFSLIHVPRSVLPDVLARIASWLRPGGTLLAVLSVGGEDAVEPDWLGAPMFFGGGDEAANRKALVAAGFDVLDDRIDVTAEPGHGAVRFHWVLATRAH